MPLTTRRGRFWVALGSPRAVRFVYAIVLIYALIIGGLMLGYTSVQSCLSDYSDLNAKVLQVRGTFTTEERILLQRVEAVSTSDRYRIIANQQALAELVSAVSAAENNRAAGERAFTNFRKVSDDSIQIFQRNETERQSIAAERARIDAKRAATPLPGPPSEVC